MLISEVLQTVSTLLIEESKIDSSLFYLLETTLTDDVDASDVEFLKRGFKKNIDAPVIGNQYYPILVVCLNQLSIAITAAKKPIQITSIDNSVIGFDNQIIQRERDSRVLYSRLFLFETESDQSSVLTILMARFNNVEFHLT